MGVLWRHCRDGCRLGPRPAAARQDSSGAALAFGALLDGIPESIVIGLSLLGGEGVSVAVVAAVFLSNLAGFLAAFALSKLG